MMPGTRDAGKSGPPTYFLLKNYAQGQKPNAAAAVKVAAPHPTSDSVTIKSKKVKYANIAISRRLWTKKKEKHKCALSLLDNAFIIVCVFCP